MHFLSRLSHPRSNHAISPALLVIGEVSQEIWQGLLSRISVPQIKAFRCAAGGRSDGNASGWSVSLMHPQTLSRIHNWQDLHPIEQERTVRLLVKKRNLVRLRQLDAENPASSGEEERLTALQGGS